MKKIAVLALFALFMASCGNYNELHTGPNGEVRPGGETAFQARVAFYNVYHDGEWHEVMVDERIYAGGAMHWPGCKFCKEKNKKSE